MENWLPVHDFEGLYEVSDLGRVRRVGRRVLKATINPQTGYENVTLCRAPVQITKAVHRIVIETFTGPCPEGLIVNHIDGDKINNAHLNLEYVTYSENMQHAVRLGLLINFAVTRGEESATAKITEAQAVVIKAAWHAGGETTRQISTRLVVPLYCVRNIAQGRTWKHLP